MQSCPNPKRVLVTGAGGFIGRWSVPALLRRGYEVHAVVSRSGSRDVPEELRGARIHVADLLADAAADSGIDDLMSNAAPTHLLHFAWVAAPGVYWNSMDNFRWLAASERLLRCFADHGGRRVMMAGSCAEYDWSKVEVCHELTSPLANDDDAAAAGAQSELSRYSVCKVALQKSLAEFGRLQGLSTAWGRIFFQFGPYERPTRLVPSVICNLLMNREAPVSHGGQVRSFLHVADVGAAFAAVLDGDLEGPVNIGSDERVVLADLIGRIGLEVGRPDLLRLGARPASPREPAILIPDVRRLRDEARWQPRYTLGEALSETIRWWRGVLAGSSGAANSG